MLVVWLAMRGVCCVASFLIRIASAIASGILCMSCRRLVACCGFRSPDDGWYRGSNVRLLSVSICPCLRVILMSGKK